MARAKARPLSATTSSASPTGPLTTSPAARATRRRSGGRWASPEHWDKSIGVRDMAEPRIRQGMVGGGEGAFIGAGALSASPDKAMRSAEAIGLRSDRSYPDFRTMAQAEAA